MEILTWFVRFCLAPCLFMVAVSSAVAQDTSAENEFDPESLCPAELGNPPEPAIAITGQFEDTGAEWLFCIPYPELGLFNGMLVVYAHGTVNVTQQAGSLEAISDQVKVGDLDIPRVLNSLGFAFGVVARSKTGLSVPEGIDETKRLVELFRDTVAPPALVYVIGVSQGGSIATLLNEVDQNDGFAGALSVCSTHGKFRAQFRYFLDFAVLFDYFFRKPLREEGISLLQKRDDKPYVPQRVIDNWETGENLKDVITGLIAEPEHADALSQALNCAGVPSDASGEMTQVEIAEELIEQSFLGINDGVETVGGNPAGNLTRLYFCSDNPLRLNLGVKRFRTSAWAVSMLNANYETTGQLNTPLVALHNLQDHRVPFWHEVIYWLKTLRGQSAEFYTVVPASGFGHCEPTVEEALDAFGLLIQKSTGLGLTQSE